MKPYKKYWLHCSHDYHGLRWSAKRTPPTLMSKAEPKTPRLCVAESLAQCFCARLFVRTVYVYRTERPRSGVKPVDVWDSWLTQERWLVPPVEMRLVGAVPTAVVQQVNGSTIRWLTATQSSPDALVKAQLFAGLVRTLDAIQLEGDYPIVLDHDRNFAEAIHENYGSDVRLPDVLQTIHRVSRR